MMTALRAGLNWLAGFLNDRGGPSSTRLIMLSGTLVPLAVWTGLSLYHLRLEALPESLLVFVGMCLGLKGVDKALSTRLGVAVVEKDKPEAPAVGVQVTTESGSST